MRLAGAKLDEVLDTAEISSVVGLVRRLAGSGYEFAGDIGVELYAGIFLLGYVIPHEGEASNNKWVEDAKALWSSWISKEVYSKGEMRDVAGSLVKETLRNIVIDDKAETR